MDKNIRFIDIILPTFSLYSKLPDIEKCSKDISYVNYEHCIYHLQITKI